MQLTRKEFLERIAGTGAIVATAGVVATASTGRPRGQVKYGIALIDFTGSYAPASIVGPCLAAAAATGTQGVEIVADKHIPGYPTPSSEWVHNWLGCMKQYRMVPSCYNSPAQAANATPTDFTNELIQDLALAKTLGFALVQPDLSRTPEPQWGGLMQRILPFAHSQGLRIALQPEYPDHASLGRCAELIGRDDSGCLGLAAGPSLWKDAVGTLGSLARVHHMRDVLESSCVFSRDAHRWELREHGATRAEKPTASELLSAGYSGFVSIIHDGPRGIFQASTNLARLNQRLRGPLGVG